MIERRKTLSLVALGFFAIAVGWVAGNLADRPALVDPLINKSAIAQQGELSFEPLPEIPQATSNLDAVSSTNIPCWPQVRSIGTVDTTTARIRLCQAYQSPFRDGLDCQGECPCEPGEARWRDSQPIPWQAFAQGEYVGEARERQVPQYRLRTDDKIEFVFRLDRIESANAYQINVGDEVRIESLTDEKLDRTVIVQPDGKITVRLLGQVQAARRTIEALTAELEERYIEFYRVPAITVTPIKLNTRLEDLRDAVDRRFGQGGQALTVMVTPEGTLQLPAIGSVPAQGLSLDELKREIDERYAHIVTGLDVTPILAQRAPRFVYVLGEVARPNRYTLEGPTTVMQAIAMAGGWNNGGNIRDIVVFRRTDDWHLIATRLNLAGAMYGNRPCPADEIWIRDTDVVLIPKSEILRANDFIELVFTRGIYGVFPLESSLNFAKASSL